MKVAVVGEAMIDFTGYCTTSRNNPECPDVPILRADRWHVNLGGAGNVAALLAQREHEVTLYTPVGGFAGALIADCCETEGVLLRAVGPGAPGWQTPAKYRVYHEGRYVQRWDVEGCHAEALQYALADAASALPADLDAIIFADYGKGLYDDGAAKVLLPIMRAKARVSVADCKPSHVKVFRGVDAVTPNLREALAAVPSVPLCKPPSALASALRHWAETRFAFVTLGADGAAWANGCANGVCPLEGEGGEWYCGAGDAFTVAVAECVAAGIKDGAAIARRANAVAHDYTRNPRDPSLYL